MSGRVDVTALKARVEIVTVIGQTVALKKSGRQFVGFCPFHENHRTPAFVVWPEAGLWKCYGACDAGGDVIAFVMRRDQCDFRAACETLDHGQAWVGVPPMTRATLPVEPAGPPPTAWQERGREFAAECQAALFAPVGAKALAYLTGPARGLTVDTIAAKGLGFNPADRHVEPARWGFPPEERPLWLPRGIVIPAVAGGQLWRLKVRRAQADPKYVQVRRPRPAPVLYNAEAAVGRRVVVFAEGEFDCLLLEQTAGDLAGVVTLGAQGEALDLELWALPYLLDAELMLAAYDVDQDAAGQGKSERGLGRLLALSRRMRRLAVPALGPGDKDITDFWMAGGDLRGWLAEELAAYAAQTVSAAG